MNVSRRAWTQLLLAACVVLAGLLIVQYREAMQSHEPLAYVPDRGQPTIVCLGDSLTQGDGAPADQSYPAWLQRTIDAAHLGYRVINAGVSGNRVGDGLSRLEPDVLRFHPRIVIVELGSNDPGHTDASVWESRLDTVVSRIQARGAQVILAGLDDPGMGDLYRRVAARHDVPIVWFIAQVATLPQDWHDAHHPNGAGYRVVMESLWPVVRSMMRAA